MKKTPFQNFRIVKLLCLGLVISIMAIGCKTKWSVSTSRSNKSVATHKNYRSHDARKVVSSAMGYIGTKYRYGGENRRGMDCSGLIFTALQENDLSFPRVSYQMAKEGQNISLGKVKNGDLLFFKTVKNKGRINHVGLVVDAKPGEIKFIHSTTSRGVIVSSLKEGYWNRAFVKATKFL